MLSDGCPICPARLSCLFVLSVTLVYCGQTVGCIKMKLGTEVGLSPGHIVLDGEPIPLSQNGHNPQFSARVRCDQTAGWMKLPLGREVDLGPRPRDIVLDGDPAALKGAQPPIFGPCLLLPNGWMDQDTTWHRGRPRPRPHCVRWGHSSLRKGHRNPLFSVHVYCSQTVADVSYCSALVLHLLHLYKDIA